MKRIGLFIFIVLMIYPPMTFGQEFYRWVDEKGTIHFTDDLSMVPERYRNQVQKKVLKEPSPEALPKVPKEAEMPEEPEPPTEQKDLIGQGEEWWRARAREWNEKLLNATKNYDAAHDAWMKAKEKELQEAKFKSSSFKRKLKAEIKVLENKMKEWEKERDQAKNMLEKVLPREAEELKANPEWLDIEKTK